MVNLRQYKKHGRENLYDSARDLIEHRPGEMNTNNVRTYRIKLKRKYK